MEEDQKENFEALEPGLNRVFEKNEKISPEFKELARTCFGRIFFMLGEKNFKRWIDMKQMRSQIKDLVIQSMDKKEIEEEPNTGGYFTHGTKKIKLRPSEEKDLKPANIHETFHLITDNKSEFCTFLDEGLTEYMKTLAWGTTTAYFPNVNTVKFLHGIIGDSLVKAYLMGKDGFDDKLLSIVNFDGKTDISDINRFYSNLDILHDYNWQKDENALFKANGATPEVIERSNTRLENAKQKYENIRPEITSMYQKIIVGKISEMTKNMDFYKFGENGIELDIKTALKAIKDLKNQFNIKDFINPRDFINLAKWEEEVDKLATEQILENTHILSGYEGKERESRKQELIEKMCPKIIATPTQISRYSPTIRDSDITPEENSNIVSKLLEKNFTENMNITQYIETIVRVATVAKLSDIELENYLNKYNIEFFGNTRNFKNINKSIISSIPKLKKLDELQEQREKDTISSEYKLIGNGKFVEKRDNQIFFVELDENGEFSEKEIKIFRQTVFAKDGSRIKIDFSKGLSNLEVEVNNQKLKLGETISIQDIKDMELAEVFSRDIRKDVSQSKYTKILDDAEDPWKIKGLAYSADIDKRSREVDFETYISELKNLIPLIPESQREKFIAETTSDLLDNTYRIPKEKNEKGEAVRDLVSYSAYSTIIETVSNLVKNGKEEDIKIANSNISLTSNSAILNRKRYDIVEENTKHAVIFFKDNDAKKKYDINLKQKNEIENKKNIDEAVKKFEYEKFYKLEGEIPTEELPYHLSGVYTTQPIDTRSVKFSYNEFANSAKDMLLNYNSNIRAEIFEKVFDIQMRKTYLMHADDKKEPNILDALENVKTIIRENVFSDTPIEDEKISENLNVLNDFRVEKVKRAKNVALIGFKNEHARNMFDSFSELIEIVKKSGITNDAVETEIKGIMQAELEREDPKNPDKSEPEQ